MLHLVFNPSLGNFFSVSVDFQAAGCIIHGILADGEIASHLALQRLEAIAVAAVFEEPALGVGTTGIALGETPDWDGIVTRRSNVY